MHSILTHCKDRQYLADLCLRILRVGIIGYAFFFPLGMTFRESGVILAFMSLMTYYALDYKNSNLSRFNLKWAFFLFLAVLLAKVAHTIHPSSSLYVLRHNFYKGPILFLVGLELIRDRKDLRILAWALIAMTFYTGLDGIYQYCMDVDIFGVPSSGRVNAMWRTSSIGNLISLTLPTAFALPILLPAKWATWKRWAIATALAFPGFFFLIGSETRSAWLGFCVATLAFIWIRAGFKKAFLAFALLAGLLLLFQPEHLAYEKIANNPRWLIWAAGLDVFAHNPLLGVGVNCFEMGYKALGITFDPLIYDPPIPHPHNIYVQFLAELGIIGTLGILPFLFGVIIQAGRTIRQKMMRDKDTWLVTTCFWCAYVGYLATGLTAHNFYRTWWLGISMTILGACVGGTLLRPVNSRRDS